MMPCSAHHIGIDGSESRDQLLPLAIKLGRRLCPALTERRKIVQDVEGSDLVGPTLQVRLALAGELDLCRGNGLDISADLELLHVAQDGLAELLSDGAGDLHRLPLCYLRTACLDEDAIGRGGVAVARGILDVEAAQLIALEAGRDRAADRDLVVDQGALVHGALESRDRNNRCLLGRSWAGRDRLWLRRKDLLLVGRTVAAGEGPVHVKSVASALFCPQ